MQLRLASVILFTLFLFSSGAHAGSSIQVRLSSAPKTLDWSIATTGSEGAILQNITAGLFKRVGNGEPKPDLAESYAWSPDRKTLEIRLKSDQTWSDGTPLIAQHFLDSFERLLNPNLSSENASLLFDLKGAREYFLGKVKTFREVGVEAKDRTTLILRLKEPRAQFLSVLTHWACSPYRKDKPHATIGPYLLKQQTKTKITLHARTPELSIQDADFQVISEGKTALELFRKKKLDYLLQLEDSLLGSPELSGLPEPGLSEAVRVVALLHINPSRVETKTPEKRRAIMRAIPVAELVELQPKTRMTANRIIPIGIAGNTEARTAESFKPEGETGSPPSATLTLAYPNDAFSKTLAEQIQAHAKKLKLVIEPLPPGELSTASKRYDLVLTLFGLDYLDPDQLLSSFLYQGTHDLFNLSSSELLKIVQEARTAESVKTRDQLYAKAAQYLESRLATVMPLFYRKRAFLIRDAFTFSSGASGTAQLSLIHLKNRSN